MNNNCEFADGGYCMCSTCQAVREAMDAANQVTEGEVETILREAEEALKRCEQNELAED